jgi:acylaminoacyl-peptidase
MKEQQKVRQPRPVTPEDLLHFRVVSDPQIAPDGRRVVFIEKHVGERNEYVSNLWMVATGRVREAHRDHHSGDGTFHAPYQFTAGGCDSSPRWSPDGRQIAFLRASDRERPQIYAIGLDGGEARRLADFPEGSIGTFCWSPNGKWLAISFRAQDPQWTQQAKKDRKEQGLSDPPLSIDGLHYRLDGDGYFGNRRYRLYLVDAEEGAVPFSARELYAEDTLGHLSFDFSPDSRHLVVATNRAAEPVLEPWKDELLRIDVASGKATPIRGLPAGPKLAVRWSPDGQTIAYAGRIGKDPAYSTENLELFVCHPTRGRARSLTAEHDLCLYAEGLSDTAVSCGDPSPQFSPDGTRLFVRLSVRGESHVASFPVAGGRPVFHTSGACDVRMGNLSADGRRMAITVGNATRLAEVAVVDCRRRAPGVSLGTKLLRNADRPRADARGSPSPSPTLLTNLNGPLLAELQLATPEPHWIQAADGHRFQLWVIRPPAAKRSVRKKVPAVLSIHGGPHAQYCASFFHEFQVLAAAGYAVFYSNPRGSKGYGRDHCAAIRGRWGTADWTDVQAVIGFMKEQPFVDRRRMGVMGGSYGGYMTNWVISHCHDFAAAITDRCISNVVSNSGSTDAIEPVSHYYPGNFWDQPEARWNQSPMKYLGNVQTPTLIIHSEGDLRCNIEQAEQLYAALKVLNVPTRFVRYPASTSHGMSRNGPPDLRIHRLRQILEWWGEYLKLDRTAK